MEAIRKVDGVLWGCSYLVLAHLPLVYDNDIPVPLLVTWYIALNLLGILTIADELGHPIFDGSWTRILPTVEVVLSGVTCAVIAVVLYFASGQGATVLVVLSGALAVLLIWTSTSALLRRDRDG